MRFDEDWALAELRGMGRAKRLLADTSALICLEKLDLLAPVRRRWRCLTIAEVMVEWLQGSPEAPELELLPPPTEAAWPSLNTDRKLVRQAELHRLPLVAEDRRILAAGEDLGLGAWCCLWLVAGLERAGDLKREASLGLRDRLSREFRYDQKRLELFEQLLFCLDKGEM